MTIMKFAPQIGDKVERIMDEEGFKDCFFEATVVAMKDGKFTVEYAELEEEDESGRKLRETVALEGIRPCPSDDSLSKPLSERVLGEAVDCWYEGGWWMGYVHKIFGEGLKVFFPGSPDTDDIVSVAASDMSATSVRVRTGFDWDAKAQEWQGRENRKYHGARDLRKKLQVKPKPAVKQGVPSEAGRPQGSEGILEGRKLDKRTAQSRLVADWSEDEDESDSELDSEQDAVQLKETPRDAMVDSEKECTAGKSEQPQQREAQQVRPTVTQNAHQSSTPGLMQVKKAAVDGKPLARVAVGDRKNAVKKDVGQGQGKAIGPERHLPTVGNKRKSGQDRMKLGGRIDGSIVSSHKVGFRFPKKDVSRLKKPWEEEKRALKMRLAGDATIHRPPLKKQKIGRSTNYKTVSAQRAEQMAAFFASPEKGEREAGGQGAQNLPVGSHSSQAKDLASYFDSPQKDARHGNGEGVSLDPKLRPGAAPASKPFTIPKLTDDPTFLANMDTRSWKQRLKERMQNKLRYNGEGIECQVCIDNLGLVFDDSTLKRDLQTKFNTVERIEFATGEFDGKRYSCGWGCLTFKNERAAVLALEKLDKMYLKVPCCPIPRPIIAHFPMWTKYPWGDEGDMPGYLKVDSVVPPHFAQRNTIEFRAAIQWRRNENVLSNTKEELCRRFVQRIVPIIRKYHGELDRPDLSMLLQRPVDESQGRACLWLKRVPVNVDDDVVRSAYDQFDEKSCCKVTRPKNPVSGKAYGHAIVEFSEDDKAIDVCKDMRIYVFHCGGTPRAVRGSLFKPGPPHGFQNVFDAAVERALQVDIGRCRPDLFSDARLVSFSSPSDAAQKCAEEIRAQLEEQMHIIAQFHRETKKRAWDLHEQQQEMFNIERRKFQCLIEACEYPVIKSIIGANGHSKRY